MPKYKLKYIKVMDLENIGYFAEQRYTFLMKRQPELLQELFDSNQLISCLEEVQHDGDCFYSNISKKNYK